MEDSLDMDDLFGEGPSLPLPSAPTAKGLGQKLDELRASGCNQKVAWSNLGCIAHVKRDGTGLVIRNLFCRPEDGKWTLGGEFPISQVSLNDDGQRIVHLSWNPSGADLAVVDVLGRLSIYTIFIAVNRVSLSRPGVVDQEDDLGAIVGMAWLNIERMFPLYRPAVKDSNGQFQYSATNHKTFGPFHPMPSRSTLIGVTRGGMVRLWYQQHDARWLEVNTELESIGSSDDLLSHASFSSDRDNSLLLVIHTTSHQIRLYRININWNIPANQKPIPQSQVPSTASLQISHVKVDDFCFPLGHVEGKDVSQSQIGLNDISRGNMSRAQLSHLEMIPPAPQLSKHSEPSYPIIMAAFSYVPTPLEESQQNIDTFSVIARWELRSAAQKLHPSFDKLGTRRNSVGSTNEQSLDLRRMSDITVRKAILAIERTNSSTTIAISYGDGSIEFRDRSSKVPITANEEFHRVSSMPQAGFAFPIDDPCLHTALSPNHCLAIGIDADGEAKLRVMEYTLGPLDTHEGDPKVTPVVIALALQFAVSCANHLNNDDLATVIQQCLGLQLERQFLSESQRAINMSVDYSHEPQHEKLFRNPMIQRCLSLQNTLGYKGELNHRTLTAKIAWATLHLRLAALTFAITFNNVKSTAGGGAENDYTRPEVLHSLLGVVRWSMDLMNFIIDDLFSLSRLTKGRTQDKEFVQQKVLASIPRNFLRYNSRALRGLDETARKILKNSVDGDQKQVFHGLKDIIDASPVKVPHFERILTDVDGSVKGAYQSQSISNEDRAAAEKEMLVDAGIPDPLMPVVGRLLTTTLNGLSNDINPAALYFEDPSWLGLSDDRSSDAFKQTCILDAIRKIPLTSGTNLRRCTRCCAHMADLLPQKGVSIWVTSMQRMCLCGSLWMLVKHLQPPYGTERR
ncbi:MAG: mediator complex subunit [Geoglossum simile]|nr:MAG: mediator complex subunit [Geoglossum simile]